MLLSEYLNRYLSTYVIPRRRPSTVACYRRAWASLPAALLAADLAAIDGMDVQAALNDQAAVHPRAAQLTYTCLSCALSRAVRLGYINRSPMQGVDKPAHTSAPAAVLNAQQLAAYLESARSFSTWPLLLIIATMGLRRGEALGLTWAAVDLGAGVLHVTQQRQRIAHGLRTVPLKSRAAVRTLPIPAPVAQELAALRRDQRVLSLSGWVCDTNPDTLRKHHLDALKRAGLPSVTLHGLRHSVATLAASQGCPMRLLQGILGHARYQLTADLYAAHLSAEAYAPHLSRLVSAIW